MSYKQWNAVIMVISALVISTWVGLGLASDGPPADASAGAWQVLWAILYVIVFNVVASVVVTVVVSIVQREELRDEAGDERDLAVNARSMRNGYAVLSVATAGVIAALAFGLDTVLVPHALFGISMLAGGVFAASQLVYYRIG